MNVDKRWLKMYRKDSFFTDPGLFKKYLTVTPFLPAVLVLAGHCAELFLNKANLVFLRNMVLMMSIVGTNVEMGTTAERSNSLKKVAEPWRTSLPALSMVLRKVELVHAGYTTLYDMVDPLIADFIYASSCRHTGGLSLREGQ